MSPLDYPADYEDKLSPMSGAHISRLHTIKQTVRAGEMLELVTSTRATAARN